MFTSSSTTLTLELSSEPCSIRPRPFRPGVPLCAGPLAADSSSRFSPRGCRPAGLMKSMSCSEPTCVGALWPASCTVTTPSAPIVTLCAPSGIVMPGCTAIAARRDELALRVDLEAAVTRVAERAVRQQDLEEAAAVDGHVERVARLRRGCPACSVFSVATTRTPVPTCRPDGSCVSCDVAAPTCRTFWYSRSSNTARPFLKPLVLTFARLFDVTVMRVCCASSPVLAAHRAGFMTTS